MQKNNDIKVMLKEAGILFVITLISGLMLGFVYELTKEPIRRQQEKAVQEACMAVFSNATQFVEISYAPDEAFAAELAAEGVKLGKVFEAKNAGDKLLGYVIETISTEGYGGNIVLYIGVLLDGTLNDISILEISETPGLGMRADEVLTPQFHQKKVSGFTYTKSGSKTESEIDAISGATVTTKAVTNAVNGGLKAAAKLIQGGGSHE
ncbi:MAG: RnfABCDGE type electron transport complex subunit G [Bacteroidales bacterium]|nr:RnfABCDGE type electron transport complex subunit G [Lachnoclostridium sp.]MCM1383578.1 RnfABCDGE type electron transport complex subunit G [Lachnoclostridium sp.]MCM1464139.1 RnfABCDGE type electron transport complex subunit G [Bacteroidales bacterium]